VPSRDGTDVTEPGDEPTAIAPPPGAARTVVHRAPGLADDKTTRLPPPPAWPARPPASGDEPTVRRERPARPATAPGGDAEPTATDRPGPAAAPADSGRPARADSLADIQNDRPGRVEPGRVEPGRVEPGRVEPGRVEPGRVEPGRVEPGRVEPGRVEPGRVEPGRAEPGRAEPGRAEPGPDQRVPQEAPAGRRDEQADPIDQEPTVVTSSPMDEGDETMRLRPPPVIPAKAPARGTSERAAPAPNAGAQAGAAAAPPDPGLRTGPSAEAVPGDAAVGTEPVARIRGTGPADESRGMRPADPGRGTGPGGESRGMRPGGESRGVGPSAASLEAVISETAPATSIAGDPATVPENDLEHTEPAAADAPASDPKPGPADAKTSDATRPDPKTRKLSSAGALIWVLLALFGFTLVVQLRSNSADDGLATARQEDLVRILSDLEARDQRLQSEINTLETSRQRLTSGVQGRQAALAEAQKRADELGLLAGTLPGRGTGLRIVIDPRGAKVKASAVLNAVQELRGAGGEVMQIVGTDGGAVRIVASTYFVDVDNGGIVVDGRQLTGPWTLLVIGQPQTMQTALQIPGGVVASVNSAGGSVTMEARSMVEVTALRKATSLQYARPVS
jgi:uncharacterized protein YlxW (UPF0749 family)